MKETALAGTARQPKVYDAVILGGGLAGLTLAIQLLKQPLVSRILVLERQKHPVREAAHKVGESTVEIGARYYSDIVGMKEHLEKQQLRKMGLRYFFSSRSNNDIASRVEVGAVYPPYIPAYQIDRGRFENALGERLRSTGGEFQDGVSVQSVVIGHQLHTVEFRRNGGDRHSAQTRWLVDASGRSSILKRQLGIGRSNGHNVNAAWWRIGEAVAVDDWSTDLDWLARVPSRRRILSTNHLMGDGYWVWLIPLASNSTSFGIVADPALHVFDDFNTFDRSLGWLRKYEPQCAMIVEQLRDKVLDFRVMKHFSHECTQVFSSERWALTGEAGLFLDPFYSPGSDFIAISNTYITDLISRDLAGDDIKQRLEYYNTQMLSLFRNSLAFYERQYPIMGNPQVMTVKIVWDAAVYWGALTLLYFHDKMCDLDFMDSIQSQLLAIARLNLRMQAFFRKWHESDRRSSERIFVNLQEMRFLAEIYGALTATLGDAALITRLNRNLELLEMLAVEILETVENGSRETVRSEKRSTSHDDFRSAGMNRIWLDSFLPSESLALGAKQVAKLMPRGNNFI